jgi:hypothetical protein
MSNKGVVLNWDSVAFLSGPSMWFTILVRALYLLSGHDVRRWKLHNPLMEEEVRPFTSPRVHA